MTTCELGAKLCGLSPRSYYRMNNDRPPSVGGSGVFAFLRRLLFGAPIETKRQIHERLPKFLALPVFASDAVSSVAYGPQEILIPLMVVGSITWGISLPIAAAIAILIAIVAFSYRQTIYAYPHGGGSYIVSRENLGLYAGLTAAASILTDYVLTVAVSVSAGVDAFVSAYPHYAQWRVELCVLAVGVVAFANLRGLRESGALFAGPTYAFIISLYTLVIFGFLKLVFGPHPEPIIKNYDQCLQQIGHGMPHALTLMLVLRSFSSGCSALTGIEAIADGVPAFKPPESKNAATTMGIMATILATLVLSISYLAYAFKALPGAGLVEHGLTNVPNYEHFKNQTLVSMIAENVFGRSWFYFVIQWATAAILILAANTAFQDFPRLSSILARDRCAPRQLANIGDRLVYSNGIALLSFFAIALLVLFRGHTTALIPLYAVGVFISFTLSQAGMYRRLRRLKGPKWRLHSAISLIGSVITGCVALIIAVTKFAIGAWIVILIIPSVVFLFHKIRQHYLELGDQLRITDFKAVPTIKTTAIVLTAGIHQGVLPALLYARTLSHDCRALYIEIDPNETPLVRERWEKLNLDMPLVILESQYRSVIGPVLDYLEEAKKERPGHVVTVVLPEFVPKKWWHKALHNQSALMLKIALLFKKDIVVTNVRYYLEK